MNLPYSVPRHSNSFMLWLLAASLLMASLFLALKTASQPVWVEFAHSAAISDSQAFLRAVPVPEPPHSQPAPTPHANATPVPPGAQLRPVPQPVPTPPPDR